MPQLDYDVLHGQLGIVWVMLVGYVLFVEEVLPVIMIEGKLRRRLLIGKLEWFDKMEREVDNRLRNVERIRNTERLQGVEVEKNRVLEGSMEEGGIYYGVTKWVLLEAYRVARLVGGV